MVSSHPRHYSNGRGSIQVKKILSGWITIFVLWGLITTAHGYDWESLKVGVSTAADVKKVLGEPTHEYRDQLLYENQRLDVEDPSFPPVRLNTVVLNLDTDKKIESIFLFPLYGTTNKELRPLFGVGHRMPYRTFLSSMGEFKVGAGTRPDEKLHYIELNAPCEVYPQFRILVIYGIQDVVTGDDLIRLIVAY